MKIIAAQLRGLWYNMLSTYGAYSCNTTKCKGQVSAFGNNFV